MSLFISTPLRYLDLLPPLKSFNFNTFYFLKLSFFVPIVEELIFRLPLRFSRINLITSGGLLLFFIFQSLNIYIAISFLILSFGFIIISIKKGLDSLGRVDNFLTKYFLWIFYFQAILFGFLHLANYNLDIRYFYLFPFYILTYIIIGCFWGYIRVRYKYGLYVCIITHIMLNGLYCLIILR
jgi:hypothetical protein